MPQLYINYSKTITIPPKEPLWTHIVSAVSFLITRIPNGWLLISTLYSLLASSVSGVDGRLRGMGTSQRALSGSQIQMNRTKINLSLNLSLNLFSYLKILQLKQQSVVTPRLCIQYPRESMNKVQFILVTWIKESAKYVHLNCMFSHCLGFTFQRRLCSLRYVMSTRSLLMSRDKER